MEQLELSFIAEGSINWYSHSGKLFGNIYQNTCSRYTSRYIFNRNIYVFPKTHHSGNTCNSQNLETIQMSTKVEWINKW